MIYLPEQQKEEIGLRFVLDKLNMCTPFGAELVNKLRPFAPGERAELTAELDNVGRAKGGYLAGREAFNGVFGIMSMFKDIRPAVEKCVKDSGYVLNEVELFELKNFLLSLKELASAFGELQESLCLDMRLPCEMPRALAALDHEGGNLRTFYIADSASPKLGGLRAEKRRLEAAITSVGDDEQKQRLREQRLQVVCQEDDEELLIRRGLTGELLASADEFFANAAAVGKLDMLLQKGKLAADNETARPDMSDGEVEFESVYNPHIAHHLQKRNKVFTPISIKLRRGTAILTGANMGGKSVALKTLTLNIMLFQMGFFVFAKKASLPMFDHIHMISEDLQSVDKGLSTFAAEIVKLQQIAGNISRGFSFVALDEFARGTNPSEGAGLARAVARYLNGKNAVSILTTHYDKVSSPEFSNYQVVGLKNLDLDTLRQKILLSGAKSFALISEHMDYSLQEAGADAEPPRDAINICRLLNLSEEILKYYY